MKLIDRMVEYFSVLNRKMKRWQRVVSVMSAIAVFVTTYALVLPAITLDVDTASAQSGIEVATENEAEAAGTLFESTEEEEPEAEPAEEEEPEAEPVAEEESEAELAEEEAEAESVAEEKPEAEPVEEEKPETEEQDEETEKASESESSDTEDARSGRDDSTKEGDTEPVPSKETGSAEESISETETAKPVVTEDTPLITEKTQLTYTEKDKDYVVYADFDETAKLPVGVELNVKEITKEDDPETYQAYYDKALEELKDKYDENTGLSFAKFYDIAFVFEGQEVEPQGNVNIKIEYKEAVEIAEETKVDAVHFDKEDEEKVDVIDTEINAEIRNSEDTQIETVDFESDKFSVYGVVGSQTFTEQYLTEDGETYNISVTAGPEAHIPGDAHLEISEVDSDSDSDKYNELFAKAEAAVTDGKDASVPYARFFDIAIVGNDGEKIQPDAPVEVKITFDETVEADKNAVFNAVHFTDDDVEVIDVTTEGEKSEDAVTVEAVQFTADGFSYYGVTYTVDFEYTDPVTGETYYYSLNGEGSINLTDLLVILGIKGEDEVEQFVAEEVENVEFSDPELVKVTHKGRALGVFGTEDWLLESLAPFNTEETLTISLKNGEEIVVKVTDANSEASANDGIKSLLTDATITGAKWDGNKYIFYQGQPYGISLSFRELNKEGGQFPMGQSFTYQLPAGFVPDGASTSGTIPITLSGGDHSGETVDLNYSVSNNGLITFSWDTTSNPEGFQQLSDSIYAHFEISIDCFYNGNSGTLDFGNDITKEVEVKNGGKVTPNKKGRYNAATNCIDYEVTIYSEGINRNVVVSDVVSGTALTYKKDATSSSNISGKEVPAPVSNNNGFSLTIPQMNDNETVTVRYSAAVNLDQLHQNPDGTWGTLTETGNKVTVTNNGHPDGDKEISGKDFEHKITMSDISKSGTALETDENGHAKIEWTINANTHANVSMAGHTISDSIDGNSVPMTYFGDGIYVSAYYENGTPAYTDRLVRWAEMTSDNTSWSWRVPNSYPDNQKLSYVIKYITDADVSDRLINTSVTNTTDSDNGEPSTSNVDVKPYGGGVTGRKKVIKTDLAANTVTWEVSFDVPETGLDSAKIVDTVPLYYSTSGQLVAVDNYIDGTVTITPGLEGNESYEVTVSTDGDNKEYVTIEFFKNVDAQKTTGLIGTGTKRKLRVQFQTEIDPDWKQAAIDHPNENNAYTHTNNADIIVNNQTIKTSASTRVDGSEPGMNKVHGAQTVYYINGNPLPTYPFVVTLQGISEDQFDDNGILTVEDTFNSKYLAYYPEGQNNTTGDNELVGYIYGATSFRDLSKGEDPLHNVAGKSTNKVVSSNGDGKILITVDRENIPVDEDGNFYPYYYVYYYLTIKDPIALEKLEKAIQTSESGVYNFLNTVTNKDFGTVTDEFGFEIPVVDKSIINPGNKPGKQNDYVYYENGNYMADYKIDVNPHALVLGDEDELTLIDDYENLAIDYTTIKIKREENGHLVDAREQDGVSWTRKGNRVTYYLRNGVHYVITYSARITGEPNDQGNVTYSNSAEFFGVKDWETHEQNISSHGSGGSKTYGVSIFKHDKLAASRPLAGAKFKLYKYTANEDDPDGWDHRPTATMDLDQPGWEYVEDIVTDPKGVGKTKPQPAIQHYTWYKLVETEAPTVHGQTYQKKDYAYVFWITDGNQADYEHYVFLNDDVVAIDNEPVLPETVSIGVTKTWTNDNGDKTRRRDITVRLFADGVPYDKWTDKNGNSLPARDDTVIVLPLKEDGTTDGYEWTELQSGPIYSVVEDGVPGYTTTYTPRSTQLSGTINVKNKYVPDKTYLHVEKKWSEKLDPNARAEDITVQLKRKVMPNAQIQFIENDGHYLYSETVTPGSVVTISYKAKNSNNSEGYTIYEGMGTGGRIIRQKATQWGGQDGSVLIEDLVIPNNGITIQFPSDGFRWSDLEGPPTITVVSSPSDSTYVEDIDFNNENRYYTISADNNWKIDIDRLVKEDDDGKYIYYIEEVGVNDNTETPEDAGYTVTYENNEGIEGGTGNDSQDTIKVTNAPQTVNVDFSKTWVNTENGEESSQLINNTYNLRIVIQLERWYLDENGAEQKIDDLYDPIMLYGDSETYLEQEYPDTYKETTETAHGADWSARFEGLPKKGQVNGKTVEYIYKIAEKHVYLVNQTDPVLIDLIKLGVFNSSIEDGLLTSSATNTFPVTSLGVEKVWKDKDNNPISPPPGVTVTVQLQRRQRDLSSNYDYSGAITPGEWSGYANVDGKTLTLQGTTWEDSFTNLPVYGFHCDENTQNKLSFVEYEYQVVESSVTINNEPVDRHYTTAVEVNPTDQKVTITNTEVETTSIEVTKIWKDQSDNNTDWVKDITIVLHKKPTSGSEVTYTYTVTEISGDGGTKTYSAVSDTTEAPAATVTGDKTNGYTIKWDKLEIGSDYSVTEEPLGEGYQEPKYAVLAADNATNGNQYKYTDENGNPLTSASNNGYIVNKPEDAVTLPQTGGPGTRLLYGMGISFIAMAGLLLFIKRRSIRDLSEGRW